MNDPTLVLTARRLRAARGVVVARDVSVTASAGDVVAVEGPNGSGKSTLPDVLRAALDAGLAIRRVSAARSLAPGTDVPVAASADSAPRRAGAVTVIALVPVMAWLGVLVHRVDGRELGRAFAAHVGGRGRAHLATDLSLLPFAVFLTAAALIWPLASQSEHHPLALDTDIVELHLAAALFGIGLGSLLALIERAGWRLLVAVTVFLGLFVVRDTPLTPLLRLSSNATTLHTSIARPAAWLCIPGAILVTAGAILATRQT
jgi:hypothetical protein